ncbi:hypothetical protein LCL97_14220 [Seohaeicola saemankumensis]|nr:hypothetical protein [Seohaeicola saemankumensis]MCA0871991.1 hypothetical protein [Seohaeicola saemankumensis]
MPVSFRILPNRGLVYVRYEGFAKLDDSFAAFAEYAQHPDRKPGQKQLVDLEQITGMEKDYAKLMALQAAKADTYVEGGAQTLLVYYAPNELSYGMARMILRSWEPIRSVVPVIQQTEAGALEILGQREHSFAEMLAQTA